MPDSLDDNTVCESMQKFIKYTKEQVNRLSPRFTMQGIDKNTCKWISELGIKCRFRGRRGRCICKPWPVKNWDNNSGIHNEVLRTLQRVDNEKLKWEQCVKIGLANVRSAKKKTEEIIHNIMEEELDLSFICETWIDNEDSVTKAKLKTELLSFKGNKQRSGKGGGIGLIYRKGYDVDVLELGEMASFEYCLNKITVSGKHQLMVLLIYRPLYSEKHLVMVGTYLDEFSDFISHYVNKHPSLIMIGDVNTHNEDEDNINRQNYRDMIDTFGYNQVVCIPTHQDGHKLVHLLVSKDCNVEFTNPEQGYKISDHYFVMTKISYRKAWVHRA